MPEYTVLRPFNNNNTPLVAGDKVELAEERAAKLRAQRLVGAKIEPKTDKTVSKTLQVDVNISPEEIEKIQTDHSQEIEKIQTDHSQEIEARANALNNLFKLIKEATKIGQVKEAIESFTILPKRPEENAE